MPADRVVAVVTGGRDYTDHEAVRRALVKHGVTEVAHGACHKGRKVWWDGFRHCYGADGCASRVAYGLRLMCRAYPIRKDLDGPWPGAGPRRNRRMLEAERPDLVLAFPGGRDTASCVRIAEELGIRVVRCE